MAVYKKDGKTVWASSDKEAEKKLSETTSSSSSSRRSRSSTTQLQRAESRLDNLAKGSTAHELQLREIAKLKGESYSEYIKSTGDDQYFKDEAVTKTHSQKEPEVKQEVKEQPQQELQFKRSSFEDIARGEAELEVQQDITKRQFMGETSLAGVGVTGQVIREHETKRPVYRGYVEEKTFYAKETPQVQKRLEESAQALGERVGEGKLSEKEAISLIENEQDILYKELQSKGTKVREEAIQTRKLELAEKREEVFISQIKQEQTQLQKDIKAVKSRTATPEQWFKVASNIELPNKPFSQLNIKESYPHLKKATLQTIGGVGLVFRDAPKQIKAHPIQTAVGVGTGLALTLIPTPATKMAGGKLVFTTLVHGTALGAGAVYAGVRGTELYQAKGERIPTLARITVEDAPFLVGATLGAGIGKGIKSIDVPKLKLGIKKQVYKRFPSQDPLQVKATGKPFKPITKETFIPLAITEGGKVLPIEKYPTKIVETIKVTEKPAGFDVPLTTRDISTRTEKRIDISQVPKEIITTERQLQLAPSSYDPYAKQFEVPIQIRERTHFEKARVDPYQSRLDTSFKIEEPFTNIQKGMVRRTELMDIPKPSIQTYLELDMIPKQDIKFTSSLVSKIKVKAKMGKKGSLIMEPVLKPGEFIPRAKEIISKIPESKIFKPIEKIRSLERVESSTRSKTYISTSTRTKTVGKLESISKLDIATSTILKPIQITSTKPLQKEITIPEQITITSLDTKFDFGFDKPVLAPIPITTFIPSLLTPSSQKPPTKPKPAGIPPGKGQLGSRASQGRRLGFEKKGYMPSLGALVIKTKKPSTKKGKPKARKYAGLFYRPVYK